MFHLYILFLKAHVWTFSPQEDKKFVLKPYVYVEDIKHEG